MDQPMMIIMANYSGASPEDMDELVTQPIEDQVSTLEGVKSMSSTTSEGRSMIMLVVLNTASIQLIPTTVATVRAAAGSAAPFDILPAVWLASALSVGVGILACKLFARVWRD